MNGHLAIPASARILVVDDHPENVRVLSSTLGELGYEIIPATDGATALKRLALRPPDLVLLDLMMPGLDGCEICRRIREQPEHADLPVIFLSSADEKRLIVRALDAGGMDYVTKPFNPAELIRRVQTHLALKAARDRLRHLAEDKDELLGILAHDLKNALGSVLMTSQVLADRTAGDARLNSMCAHLVESTERTLQFVRQFLANAAAERGLPLEPQPVTVPILLAEVARQYQRAAERKDLRMIGPELGATPSEQTVQADAAALRQILDNLVSNAVKFSPSGRSIHLTVDREPGALLCRIRDEGPGFTPEDRQRLFRRYQRLSARPTAGEPSTGLGLSIAHQLATRLGGTLECESCPGAGATFTLRLPVS